MANLDPVFLAKLVVVAALWLFLPLTAITYYFFRRPRRLCEIDRVFSVVRIIPDDYRAAFREENPGPYYFGALAYIWIVSAIGLGLFAFHDKLGVKAIEPIMFRGVAFPQEGTWLVAGMAFLGAYLWGIRYVYRRYTQNDLNAAVFYNLSLRMFLAIAVAVVLFNAAGALAGADGGSGGITANVWPAMGLLIGMFPQRGLDWLTERVPILTRKADPSVRPAPLEMIEGVTIDDRMRLQEVGIDTCYDLATADFVPLILRTPYGARELSDWILQAKLCVCFGPAVKDLREHSIRTVIDLARLNTADLEMLAVDTPLTRSALQRARDSVKNDPEIHRLQSVGLMLGKFVGESRKRATRVGEPAEIE